MTNHHPDGPVERLLHRWDDGTSDGPGPDVCPEAEDLAAFYDGSAGGREDSPVATHASRCARCQATLASMVRSDASEGLAAAEPARSGRWLPGWRWVAPAAAAAAAGTAFWLAVDPARLTDPRELQAPATTVAERSTARDAATAADRVDETVRPPSAPPGVEAPAQAEASAGVPSRPAPSLEDAPRTRRLEIPTEVPTREQRAPTAAAPEAARTPTAEVSRAGAEAELASRNAGIVVTSAENDAVRWRLGEGGLIERSTNGGASWQSAPPVVTTDLTAGSAPSDTSCWVVGRGGTVLRTTDGVNWASLTGPGDSDLVAVEARTANEAVVVAATGARSLTQDGGRSWTPLPQP